MSRYRKIDPRIWNDEEFRLLTDRAKLLFLFILTHPHMTALGAMRATTTGLSGELGWTPEAFGEAFRQLLRKPLLKANEKACFLGIPNFLKYNPPESPNVIKSWGSWLDFIPECNEKYELIQYVKAFTEALPEAFAKALPKAFQEAFRKAIGNHEHEHEHEHELKEREDANPKPKKTRSAQGSKRVPENWNPSEALIAWAQKERPDLDVLRESAIMKDHEFQRCYTDWDAVFRNWIRKAESKRKNDPPKPDNKPKCKTCNGTGCIVRKDDVISAWTIEKEVDQGLTPDICPDCKGKNRIQVPGLPKLRFPS